MGEKKDFRKGDRVYHEIIRRYGTFTGDYQPDGQLIIVWDGWITEGAMELYLLHDTDINVGDKIRVTGSNVGDDWNGEIGKITNINNRSKHPYRVINTSYADGGGLWCTGIKVSPDVTNETNNNTTTKGGEGMEREYKKGDRVIVKGVTGGRGWKRYIGQCGVYKRECGGNGCIAVVIMGDGYELHCTSIELVDDVKETVTSDGYVYTKLKSLSPESVLKGGPRRDEFENYTNEFSFYEDVELGTILDYDDDYPAWLPWLVSHGYIGKEEVKKEVVTKQATIRLSYWSPKSGENIFTKDICGDSNGLLNCGFHRLEGKKNITMTLTWEE